MEVGELGAKAIIEGFKFGGAVNGGGAIVNNSVGSEEFGDGITAALIPDFMKPANDEVFVLFDSGDSWGGGHWRSTSYRYSRGV